MYLYKITALLAIIASAVASPVPETVLSKRALTFRTYNTFQVSNGVAGNALAEVNAAFPVNLNNPAAVSASDLAILVAARQTAENAEATFNTQVAAASGTAATALQIGKIKNKVLKLRLFEMVGLIQQAQGNTGGAAAQLSKIQGLLATNVGIDKGKAGQKSQSVSFTGDVQP
ncbi:hypothetical protein GQ53DRAFT_699863 [Thozetella sp. PMI_491]|nr:hypothetical protein GQ53DRAFT_699863 [Thozetella sp. PMI_491]